MTDELKEMRQAAEEVAELLASINLQLRSIRDGRSYDWNQVILELIVASGRQSDLIEEFHQVIYDRLQFESMIRQRPFNR